MRLWLSSVFRYFKWTQLTMRTLWILIENQYKNRLMRRGGATLHHHKPKPPMAVTLIGKEQHKRKRPRELRGGAAHSTNNLHRVRLHVYRPLKWAANKVRNLNHCVDQATCPCGACIHEHWISAERVGFRSNCLHILILLKSEIVFEQEKTNSAQWKRAGWWGELEIKDEESSQWMKHDMASLEWRGLKKELGEERIEAFKCWMSRTSLWAKTCIMRLGQSHILSCCMNK